MNKAKEISALWSQIKPQIGEMVRLCHEVEDHAEVTADAYQRGYETAKHECEECQKIRYDAEQELVKKAYDTAYADAEEIYESGKRAMYQKGLKDAWDAARKLWKYGTKTLHKIFGEGVMRMDFFMKFEASEAIEKIRQYEQRQEEQIQVGDEVENTQTGARFIITHMWVSNHGEKGVSGFNCECSAFSTALDLVRKTGRHFPEIVEVLQKMMEN